jgi:hypothetical protein
MWQFLDEVIERNAPSVWVVPTVKAEWINEVDWIAGAVSVEIQPAPVADRVAIEESAKRGS